MRKHYYYILGVIPAVAFCFQNCSPAKFQQGGTIGVDAQGGLNPNGSNPVCNPFGGGPIQQGHGLAATLRYLTPGQIAQENAAGASGAPAPFKNFSDVYNKGAGSVANPILIGDLNVPDRYFSTGMMDSNGQPVVASDGSIVRQYFGFIATGKLVLGNLAPGDYEVATITDDGSILTIKSASQNRDGTYSDVVINNDGFHSAKMGCTSQIVHLDSSSAYDLTLDYIQGPPVTIAMIMLLRPHPSSGYTADPQCDQGGASDTYFFQDNDGAQPTPNPISPAIEQKPYKDVLSRQWTPVTNANLLLPANSSVQDCH